jgi:hypothetical protein
MIQRLKDDRWRGPARENGNPRKEKCGKNESDRRKTDAEEGPRKRGRLGKQKLLNQA